MGLKNLRLLDADREDGIGLTVVDRCAPDAVTFTQPEGWKDKARSLLEAVSPGKANRKVHSGHVILFQGDATEIKVRAEIKSKPTTEKYTETMQSALQRVYGDEGVTHLDVRGLTARQVAKEVARIIHLGDYTECNLQGRLESIRDGVIATEQKVALE